MGPINLTEASDRVPWSEVDKALRVSARSGNAVLEIRGLGYTEQGHANDGLSDTAYVIVAGFGVLRCEEAPLEFTTGDVLFVPRGCPHRLERLDGEIRLWKISLAPASSIDEQPDRQGT
nr:AraC family ligand binding domain-containing protein [Pararoseomonas indoligenes]